MGTGYYVRDVLGLQIRRVDLHYFRVFFEFVGAWGDYVAVVVDLERDPLGSVCLDVGLIGAHF